MSDSEATHSCLYEGVVGHRRLRPRQHEFRVRVSLCYLDLSELPDLLDGLWLWSRRRPAIVRFRRSDYHGPPDIPLDEAVRDTVQDCTGLRPCGPIRLLTTLRQFGYSFNPVSFYYCFDADDKELECVVAEITNTPWNERRAYVLPVARAQLTTDQAGDYRYQFRKDFHISPFLPPDLDYDWRFSTPAAQLNVAMRVEDADGHLFDATLRLKRRRFSLANRSWSLVRYPCIPAAVMARIYWEAGRLWLKKIPVFPHPKNSDGARQAETNAPVDYLSPPLSTQPIATRPFLASNERS